MVSSEVGETHKGREGDIPDGGGVVTGGGACRRGGAHSLR